MPARPPSDSLRSRVAPKLPGLAGAAQKVTSQIGTVDAFVDSGLEKQKRRVAQETLATEQSYVNNVRAILKFYFFPLRDAVYSPGGAIIGMDKIVKIFANLEDILLINEELLKKLHERVEENGESRLGDIFLNMAFALKLYSRYMSNFIEACASPAHPCTTRMLSPACGGE